jgi:hypothetical protein
VYPVHLFSIGTPETNRTSDLSLRRGELYPLSYRGVCEIVGRNLIAPHDG